MQGEEEGRPGKAGGQHVGAGSPVGGVPCALAGCSGVWGGRDGEPGPSATASPTHVPLSVLLPRGPLVGPTRPALALSPDLGACGSGTFRARVHTWAPA